MENVAIVPLNAEGALELGLYPCDYCNMGWGTYSSNGEIRSCRENCEYIKRAKNELEKV